MATAVIVRNDLVVEHESDDVVELQARRVEDNELCAGLRISHQDKKWTLKLEVMQQGTRIGGAIGDLVSHALDLVVNEGGGWVQLWLSRPQSSQEQPLIRLGFTRGRDLYQLRCELPLQEIVTLSTRSFERSRDEVVLLEVNNRAFVGHPDQSNWSLDRLDATLSQPWFDPKGLLLHEIDGQLAGFCWTKVHEDHDPPLGEAFLLAVDPDFRGRELGKQLLISGFAWLASQGCRAGMLYVDAASQKLVDLYQQLGFTLDHVDREYVISV